MKASLVSVIIVNWNGKQWLEDCFNSLYQQTYKNFEIIMVDNDSNDGSVAFVKKHFPEVKIIKSKKNLGFAGGNNLGLKYAKGKYIWLLNNDTISDKNALKNLLASFDQIKNLGVAQSKLILMDDHDTLDSCGAYLTKTGYLFHYGLFANANDPKFNKPFPVYTVKGASMLIKKEVIDKVGGLFDDDYFAYFEETDFCHRAWLAGYECWYWPDSVIYHKMGGTSVTMKNAFIQFHSFKNKIQTYIKNLSWSEMIVILPIHLGMDVSISFVYLFTGKFAHFWAVWKAIWWNILNLRFILSKRQLIYHNNQKLPLSLYITPHFRYYLYLFLGKTSKIKSLFDN